jgi:inosine/xanthosine triphosphatase
VSGLETIVVGSTNPVKAAATRRIFPHAVVQTAGVASGVPAQPRSVAETIAGARTRASAAYAARSAELAVGIEGGVAPLPVGTGWQLIMWAAVTDGDRMQLGMGPGLTLPAAIAAPVADGIELGLVMDTLADATDTAQGAGAVGLLTDGRLTRTDALAAAVATAAAPWLAPGQF